MTMKRTFLIAGGLFAIALTPSARSADLSPMIVTNLAGGLRIQQGIPCDDDVDLTTPVTGGLIAIAPAGGIDVPGGKQFTLTRATVSFAPFSIDRSCLGFGEMRNYSAINVQLARAASFTATPAG